jgi:predicted ATPase/DNA-binding XRE family transcriptional regulator
MDTARPDVPAPVQEAFGALLRRYRLAAGLSQEELAERAGLSVQGLSALENGRRQAPYRHTVTLLATALGLTAMETAALVAAVPRNRLLAGGAPTTPAAAPVGTSLRSLGAHQLKGLTQPEEIYQVVHPGLPAEFPPLASPAAYPSNLPVALTSFIGREREQSEVWALHAAARLVTLTGTGGVGKTRLALAVAAALEGEYPDGIWLVELAPLTDPALVVQAVVLALGMHEQPNRPLLNTLVDHLRERYALLVLDNCEHLVGACAELATLILQRCPGIRILATSRERLGVSGETLYRVPSLDVPEGQHLSPEEVTTYSAVRLFVERARASDTTFSVGAEHVADLLIVCARLDGIPLALELAAAQIGVFSLRQFAGLLDDRFLLLIRGGRTALPRQQTLRALLDWSYDLLTEPERQLFRRLAVFAGGWTLAAAEAVCASDREGALPTDTGVLALLINLVNKSLALSVPLPGGLPEARFRLLETIRAYGLERLSETGELADMRERHTRYFLALAERAEPELRGATQAQWLRGLDAERDNLRAALRALRERGDHVRALRLAGALWRYWYVRGLLREGRSWLEDVLAASAPAPDVPVAARARALYGAASLAEGQGDYARATTLAQEALDLHRASGDRAGIAAALNNLGNVARNQADLPRAVAMFEESLALWRELDQRQGMAGALNNLGATLVLQGDLDRAEELARESLELRRALGDEGGMAIALDTLANVARARGDLSNAEALYEQCLALWQEVGDTWGRATGLSDLAIAHCLAGEPDRAEPCAEQARALWQELEDGRSLARTLCTLGVVACLRGDLDRAVALHRQSLAGGAPFADTLGAILDLEGLATATEAQGRPERATVLLAVATALRAAAGAPLPPVKEAACRALLSALRAALGEDAFAAAWARSEALTLPAATDYASGEAD